MALGIFKWVCPAILVLLQLVAGGGSSPPALASAPAAKYIGADAYSNPTWAQAGTPSSQYYLGSLQSDKLFYKDGLPNSDANQTSNGVPGCGAKNGTTYVYPASVLCVIVYNAVTSGNDANLTAFLQSTLNDPHHMILAFCNEPENGNNDNGCMCFLGTETNCGTPGNFLNQFETESSEVKAFELQHGASNVQFAQVSWASHYTSGTGGCNFIVPSQYVNFYLVDIYQGRNGIPITRPQSLGQDTAWTNWVSCTSAAGVARGIAEFAINCGEEHTYEQAVATSYSEDDSYLKANFPNLKVWNLWDSGGCAINNDPVTGEPHAVRAWQSIEAGN